MFSFKYVWQYTFLADVSAGGFIELLAVKQQCFVTGEYNRGSDIGRDINSQCEVCVYRECGECDTGSKYFSEFREQCDISERTGGTGYDEWADVNARSSGDGEYCVGTKRDDGVNSSGCELAWSGDVYLNRVDNGEQWAYGE